LENSQTDQPITDDSENMEMDQAMDEIEFEYAQENTKHDQQTLCAADEEDIQKFLDNNEGFDMTKDLVFEEVEELKNEVDKPFDDNKNQDGRGYSIGELVEKKNQEDQLNQRSENLLITADKWMTFNVMKSLSKIFPLIICNKKNWSH